MPNFELAPDITLAAIVALILINHFTSKKKYLSEDDLKKASNKIQRTSKLDPNHSVIESHKIMITTIQQMQKAKKKNASELLTKVRKRIPNQDDVWKYHRLRNKAAHKLDFAISPEEAKHARSSFKKALKALAK